VPCSKTVGFTQAQFEQKNWTYTATISANALDANVTVPDMTVTVEHTPEVQLTLDPESCHFSPEGEARWRLVSAMTLLSVLWAVPVVLRSLLLLLYIFPDKKEDCKACLQYSRFTTY
jgi:hypothetical protein